MPYIGRGGRESKLAQFRLARRFDTLGQAYDSFRRITILSARLSAPGAGAILETILAAVLAAIMALALPGSATAQHDEDHRGSGRPPPQQHPGGGPPPKPFVAPRGPNTGAPPGAQIITPVPHPGGEGIHPGMPPSGAEIVRPGGPHPEFVHPGEPHPGAEFVRPGGRHPRADLAVSAGAVLLSRPLVRARPECAVCLSAGLGLSTLGSRRRSCRRVFLVRDYWYTDWDLLDLAAPTPGFNGCAMDRTCS